MDDGTVPIRALDPEAARAAVPELARVLHACVADRASVGFVLPFSVAEAERWWLGRLAALEEGGRHLFIAGTAGRVLGTVTLDLAAMPNQRHRADIAKLLVDPPARRRGLAGRLMAAAEAAARARRRWLLVLDTRAGDVAEQLYLKDGWQIAGRIPDYAEAPETGRFDATTVLWKRLSATPPAAG